LCSGSDAVNGRQLLVGPSDIDALLGDVVVLECAANKYTQPAGDSEITWTRNG